MSSFTKKDLDHKLHIQHRNTRYDAIDVINNYFIEINNENEVIKKSFMTFPVFDPAGQMIQCGRFNEYGYRMMKKDIDVNKLTSLIMNLKQRKPKEGE